MTDDDTDDFYENYDEPDGNHWGGETEDTTVEVTPEDETETTNEESSTFIDSVKSVATLSIGFLFIFGIVNGSIGGAVFGDVMVN